MDHNQVKHQRKLPGLDAELLSVPKTFEYEY